MFVGFGALIGVSRGTSVDAIDLGRIRGVVTIGLVVIVAALIPVGLARYGLTPGTFWRISSGVSLALIWFAILAPLQNEANREAFSAQASAAPVEFAFFWLGLEIPIQVPLFLALLGMYPALFPAFYTTALVLNLLEAAFLLAQLVFAQDRGA